VKAFGVTFEQALYDVSYANVLLYLRTLPDYGYESKNRKDKKGRGEVINADDPANRDKIEKLLFG